MGKPLKIILALAVLAAAAAGLWAWQGGDNQGPRVKGRSVKVRRGAILRLVTSTGTVKARVGAEVKVGARISGKVEKLNVQIGQRVKAGQVVAIIEHRDLDAKLAQARAEVKEVEASLLQARRNLRRQSALLQDDLVSQDTVDQAQEKLGVLLARLAAAQARLRTAEVNRSYAQVVAPISGIVASVSTQEGETVSASLSAPTFITIVDLARLQVDNYVDETDIGRVKIGQRVSFTVDAFPEKRFKGEVEAVYPTAKIINDVVYYPVIVKITSDFLGYLKPEMTANVSIQVERKTGVLLLPATAVRRQGGRSLVYLKDGERVVPTPVKLGITQGSRVEIISGVSEGQEVLLTGSARSSRGRSLWGRR